MAGPRTPTDPKVPATATRLARRLHRFLPLPAEAVAELEGILGRRDVVARHSEFVLQERAHRQCFLLLSGAAISYRLLPDGRRHVTNFLVPGDFIGLHRMLFERAFCSVAAIEECVLASIEPAALHELCRKHVALLAALFWSDAVDHTLLAERAVMLGRRNAEERIAFILVELWDRLRIVGLAEDRSYVYPLNQTLLADATGLSVVHVNRTLRQLDKRRLVTVARWRVTIHDMAELRRLADLEQDVFDRFAPSAATWRVFVPSAAAGLSNRCA